MLLAGCGNQTERANNEQIISSVSPQRASELTEQESGGDDVVIIDVRTPEEFAERSIPGAINIDYNSPGFSDAIDKLDKTRAYVIYCRSGRRSGLALELMKNLKFQEVYDITGGLNAVDTTCSRGTFALCAR
jgi:rhodanese-related sulfurtransferase